MARKAGEMPTSPSELVLWARSQHKKFDVDMAEWRADTVKAYDIVAGHQWDPDIKSEMTEEGRPCFTFNRIAGFIRGICGLETASRNQVTILAREIDDSGASDVWNAGIRWVREQCDAEDEESDAFKDMLTCGLGWTETLYTNELDPEGQVIVERMDPLEVRWDSAAKKRGLADRRWNSRTRGFPLSTIREIWGNAKADEVEGLSIDETNIFDDFARPHDATHESQYPGDTNGSPSRPDDIPVTQFQYFRTARMMRVQNPASGQVEDVPMERWDAMPEKAKRVLKAMPIKKREYRQVLFAGTVELEDGPLPSTNFTMTPMTGVRDRNRGVFYGFVRDLEDPQQWINKFFSAMADVVASQAKGGLLAEVDAFVSKQQAEDEWADPRSIIWMKSGGMQKIKERQSAGVPQGFAQLLEFTVESLPHVAGVNLEFLGLAGREQPGVLEHQRKQAAIATLAEFFNSIRLYRKQQGRVLLEFIDTFISDGRLIRVVGKKDAKYVSLAKQPGSLKYDVIVDEAPTSPDQKNRTWDALTQILPAAASVGFPIPPEVIEYAPFPQSLIDDWMEFAQNNGMSPQAREQINAMQQQLQALQQENQKLKDKRQESMANLQIKQVESQSNIQLATQQFQQEMALQIEKFRQEMELERQKAVQEFALEQQRLNGQLNIQQQQADNQAEIARQNAQNQRQSKREE